MSTARPTLIINARLIDPETGREEAGALAVEDGVIREMGHAIDASSPPDGALVIDARGRALSPGLVDLRAFVIGFGQSCGRCRWCDNGRLYA